MFVGREKELEMLSRAFGRPGFIVIYGKRRVGKTELIKQFLKKHEGVYFMADRRPAEALLKEISVLIGRYFNDEIAAEKGFSGWVQLFKYLGAKTDKPFVLAVDEYPYLTESDPSVSSQFQKGWDEYLKDSKILLLISGSSMSVMQEEALGSRSPLFGRRTAQINLKPMLFEECRKFFPGASYEEALNMYAIAGGMPAYLLKLDSGLSASKNAEKFIFPQEEYLHSEPEFLLRDELRQPRYYFEILKAIAFGKTKYGEIASETGLEKSHLTKYLNVLESLQMTERENPVTEKNPSKTRKGIYIIRDNFIHFWFNYVYPNRSAIEIGSYKKIVKKIDDFFHLRLSQIYEQACREAVASGVIKDFMPEKTGRWWDNNSEIDILAVDESAGRVVFGEAKWTNRPVDTGVLKELKDKAYKTGLEEKHDITYALFSKSGFTPELIHASKKEKTVLFHKDKQVK